MTNVRQSLEKDIVGLLRVLSPRARKIVRQRYGLGGLRSFTLEAIGRSEGITRERVRQVENDALGKIKKSDSFRALGKDEQAIADVLRNYGGVVAQEVLMALPAFGQLKDSKALFFFLDLAGSIFRKKEDEILKLRWCLEGEPIDKIETAIARLVGELKTSQAALRKEQIFEKLTRYLNSEGVEGVNPAALDSYVGLARHVKKNPWGEYGHVSSLFIRPRGMRESAYIALARAQTPLHFREIAGRIEEFSPKRVHVQTVHNELIKDDRFVLIGRGLYALREWGYEPGFVKDILVKLLADNGTLGRDRILAEVIKKRQVKPSTILINLQNKKLFKRHDDGTYTLVS